MPLSVSNEINSYHQNNMELSAVASLVVFEARTDSDNVEQQHSQVIK